MTKTEIQTLIRRRRAQMVIHSYLYYVLDNPIISDNQWQAWADELANLQTEHPDCCKIKYYDREFSDWTGDTGMHLPKTPAVQSRAKQILRAYDEFNRVDGFL